VSFVFFDTETTGLKRGFDQILHFAAVRTDADLNEIGRFEVRSRLLPHVLPHPSALLTNGLPIPKLTDPQLESHYTMVGRIRAALLSASPAIFVGFNSIRFDEEMLRHAFFQCLYPAYLTSNHNNCRADALSLVMAADGVSPAQLKVPNDAEGRQTFRLQALAAANGIQHERAHDAMSDALATLALCRLVRERSPELWQRFVRFSNKAAVAAFVEAEEAFVFTEFFGGEAYHAPVACLGADPDMPNGRLCLNLHEDLDQLAALSAGELTARFGTKPSPIRRLRVNAAPTLTALYDATDGMLADSPVDVLEARARRIKQDPGLISRFVAAYMAGRTPFPVSPHLEERLYNGFPAYDDEVRAASFHQALWQDRLDIVQSFDDDRLRWFGLRLIYCEARATLPDALRADIERQLSAQLNGDGSGAMSYDLAIAEITGLMDSAEPSSGVLSEYHQYLTDRRDRVARNMNEGLRARP
jgi:exodeoxyribonuclease-1